MLDANNVRREDFAAAVERVNRRENRLLENRAAQGNRPIQVGEDGNRRGVGLIVRRDEHRLQRCDRSAIIRGQPFL